MMGVQVYSAALASERCPERRQSDFLRENWEKAYLEVTPTPFFWS